MLIIRLQRVGRRNDPSFRVVVCEKKGPPQGQYLEKVGTYDVRRGNIVFDKERALYWISQGAQPSPTVHNLLISSGIIEGKKIPKHKKGMEQPKETAAVKAPASEAKAKETTIEAGPVEVSAEEEKKEG